MNARWLIHALSLVPTVSFLVGYQANEVRAWLLPNPYDGAAVQYYFLYAIPLLVVGYVWFLASPHNKRHLHIMAATFAVVANFIMGNLFALALERAWHVATISLVIYALLISVVLPETVAEVKDDPKS